MVGRLASSTDWWTGATCAGDLRSNGTIAVTVMALVASATCVGQYSDSTAVTHFSRGGAAWGQHSGPVANRPLHIPRGVLLQMLKDKKYRFRIVELVLHP